MKFRVPKCVAWVEANVVEAGEPTVYVMVVPDGHPSRLVGIAAVIWDLAARGEDVLTGIAEATGLGVFAIADDAEVFTSDLVSRGFLVRVDEG